LYKAHAQLVQLARVRGPRVRSRRGLSRYLYVFDDVPLGLEVDYTTLTVFCLPGYTPPYEWSWTLAYYLTWGNASAYCWRYTY
jgi:hypothetical protein